MGQMLLILGAMSLLSVLTVSVNNFVLDYSTRAYEAQAFISATAVARGMMETISLATFDQKTATLSSIKPMAPESLTAVTSLGKDAGEVFPNFNDIDDFKNYKQTVTDPRLGNFQVSANVWYVNPSSPNDTSTVRTWYKKILVIVKDTTGKILSNPVQIWTIKSW